MAPTGSRMPSETCARIQAYLEDSNLSASDIGKEVGRSTRTIERMRQSLDLFGTPYLPKVNSPGRPRALAKSQVDWLVDYLNDKPTAYFDELALAIYDEFGIDVHPSIVGLVLKRRNWTRKAVKERALQQSAVLRAI